MVIVARGLVILIEKLFNIGDLMGLAVINVTKFFQKGGGLVQETSRKAAQSFTFCFHPRMALILLSCTANKLVGIGVALEYQSQLIDFIVEGELSFRSLGILFGHEKG